ncbi:MAG: hypothetical protein AAF363_17855 [Bacteroidota bacterium]
MSRIIINLKYESGELKYSYSERGPFQPMSPETTTDVHSGDVVEWVCAPNSGLNSISISKAPTSPNDIFSVEPHPVTNPDGSQNDKCWVGDTKTSAEAVEIEKYDITYVPTGQSRIVLDPKLKLEPDGGNA